jgi:hypothetical protein
MNKFQEARPTRQLTQAGHFLPFLSLRLSSLYVTASILPIFADELTSWTKSTPPCGFFKYIRFTKSVHIYWRSHVAAFEIQLASSLVEHRSGPRVQTSARTCLSRGSLDGYTSWLYQMLVETLFKCLHNTAIIFYTYQSCSSLTLPEENVLDQTILKQNTHHVRTVLHLFFLMK